MCIIASGNKTMTFLELLCIIRCYRNFNELTRKECNRKQVINRLFNSLFFFARLDIINYILTNLGFLHILIRKFYVSLHTVYRKVSIYF